MAASAAGGPPDGAELPRRLHQQELVAALATFALHTDELQPVLDEACRVAAAGMGCALAKVLEHRPAQACLLMCAGVGWHEGVVGHVRFGDDTHSPAGFALRTGKPVISNHLDTEIRFRTPAVLAEHGVRRAFNVLIPAMDRPWGVLEVDSPEPGDFDAADTAFLQGLAGLLGGAVARHARQQALRDSEAFAHSLLEASPDCMTLLDLDGTVQAMNANGYRLMEVEDPGAVRGQPWEAMWPPSQREAVRRAVLDARTSTVHFDASFTDRTGAQRWWDVMVRPIGGAQGQQRRLLSLSRDITGRVEAIQAKDLLMQEVHHRVKNSLQLVQNLLSLQGRVADGQAAGQLAESAARVRTIAAMHDRLYRSGDALSVEVGPYLLGLVEDLRAGMASTLDDRPIDVEADEATWPAAEVTTLGLVLTELVTNALKYGCGTILVQFRRDAQGGCTLMVEDGGTLPDGFDPAQSRGLGMRLVRGLLRGPGAGLDVDRDSGRTRFVAHLPALRGQQQP